MTLHNHEDYILWFKKQGHLRGHESRPHCHDAVLRYAVTLQVWTHPNTAHLPCSYITNMVFNNNLLYIVFIH